MSVCEKNVIVHGGFCCFSYISLAYAKLLAKNDIHTLIYKEKKKKDKKRNWKENGLATHFLFPTN